MKEIFERPVSNKRPVKQNYKMNLVTPLKTNQVRYGTKSLRSLAPKVWNSLPVSIKSSENLGSFVQNDFRFYLYVFVCFCFTGAINQIENY